MDNLIKKHNHFKKGIVQCFLDADLRGSHPHLVEVAKKQKMDLESLEEGQYVVFINKRKTLMKVYVFGNTFSFTRRERIDLAALQYLPVAFGGKGFDFDLALKESLSERLITKKKRGKST